MNRVRGYEGIFVNMRKYSQIFVNMGNFPEISGENVLNEIEVTE